ncbi:DUF1801 domain-containing protein [Pseudaestuariivita atlantica]|uniref:YdhG-like domain-containing protein n=1 Tax=Pseudaestuariivita atlantica TaxID=1317121 RepID=A0A0L1JUJ2_9RHOB|nr:DUF1801 domain-containing protein [Pseudaestuariivita atlantica]KNG95078.1 hypothetical protein ATO11_06400 [Pseudaestuariivita atlantica]
MPDAVARAFARFEPADRSALLAIRRVIFEEASLIPELGGVTETLKWGEPSYAPVVPRTGSPIRLGLAKAGGVAVFAHCQTSLIADFRHLMGARFAYDGSRAVLAGQGAHIPDDLRPLIRAALTYHKPSLRGQTRMRATPSRSS